MVSRRDVEKARGARKELSVLLASDAADFITSVASDGRRQPGDEWRQRVLAPIMERHGWGVTECFRTTTSAGRQSNAGLSQLRRQRSSAATAYNQSVTVRP